MTYYTSLTLPPTNFMAAYSTLTHGLTSWWTFLTRTVPNLSSFLAPLEEAILNQLSFLHKLSSHQEHSVLALPIWLGVWVHLIPVPLPRTIISILFPWHLLFLRLSYSSILLLTVLSSTSNKLLNRRPYPSNGRPFLILTLLYVLVCLLTLNVALNLLVKRASS